jgi:hypothetical protein
MADPVGLKDAIAGLVKTAAQVSEVFKKIVVDAPAVAASALAEVKAFSIAIGAIQKLVIDLEAAEKDRASLIELDHLVVILTDAVLTFSELKKAVDSVDMKSRLRLARRQNTILRLLDRVKQHQLAMSLILHVMQWSVCPIFLRGLAE